MLTGPNTQLADIGTNIAIARNSSHAAPASGSVLPLAAPAGRHQRPRAAHGRTLRRSPRRHRAASLLVAVVAAAAWVLSPREAAVAAGRGRCSGSNNKLPMAAAAAALGTMGRCHRSCRRWLAGRARQRRRRRHIRSFWSVPPRTSSSWSASSRRTSPAWAQLRQDRRGSSSRSSHAPPRAAARARDEQCC